MEDSRTANADGDTRAPETGQNTAKFPEATAMLTGTSAFEECSAYDHVFRGGVAYCTNGAVFIENGLPGKGNFTQIKEITLLRTVGGTLKPRPETTDGLLALSGAQLISRMPFKQEDLLEGPSEFVADTGGKADEDFGKVANSSLVMPHVYTGEPAPTRDEVRRNNLRVLLQGSLDNQPPGSAPECPEHKILQAYTCDATHRKTEIVLPEQRRDSNGAMVITRNQHMALCSLKNQLLRKPEEIRYNPADTSHTFGKYDTSAECSAFTRKALGQFFAAAGAGQQDMTESRTLILTGTQTVAIDESGKTIGPIIGPLTIACRLAEKTRMRYQIVWSSLGTPLRHSWGPALYQHGERTAPVAACAACGQVHLHPLQVHEMCGGMGVTGCPVLKGLAKAHDFWFARALIALAEETGEQNRLAQSRNTRTIAKVAIFVTPHNASDVIPSPHPCVSNAMLTPWQFYALTRHVPAALLRGAGRDDGVWASFPKFELIANVLLEEIAKLDTNRQAAVLVKVRDAPCGFTAVRKSTTTAMQANGWDESMLVTADFDIVNERLGECPEAEQFANRLAAQVEGLQADPQE